MRKELKAALRYSWIIFGLFLIANGIVFLLRSKLGVSPWDVLHAGIALQTGISLGKVIQVTGFLILLVSWAFHVQPRFVTMLNMFFIGYFVDLINGMKYIPQPDVLWLRFVCYLTGVAICGFGTALYISGNRGAGPRDSLMLALAKVLPLRVGVVRTLMEVLAATIGYFLGGPLGVGTVLFAVLIGAFVELGFKSINILKQTRFFRALWDKGTGVLSQTAT